MITFSYYQLIIIVSVLFFTFFALGYAFGKQYLNRKLKKKLSEFNRDISASSISSTLDGVNISYVLIKNKPNNRDRTLEELIDLKDEAIMEEDYEEAARLKILIDKKRKDSN